MIKIIGTEESSFSRTWDGEANITSSLDVRRQVDGDSLQDIVDSLPEMASKHDKIDGLFLTNIEVSPNGNLNRRVQALVTLTYSTLDWNDGWNFSTKRDTDGISSISITYSESSRAMRYAYTESGKAVPLINAAGCRIEAMQTVLITVLNVNYRDHLPPPDFSQPQINKEEEKIAGRIIPPLCGKLMPIAVTRNIDKDFYECALTVQIHPYRWTMEVMNAGTMCYWKDDNDAIVKHPANIYRYTPWKSTNIAENMKTAPEYGSIDNVIAAQAKYWDVTQDKTDRIPYEEITEPMPLNPDGTLRITALEGGVDPDQDPSSDNTTNESSYLYYKRYDCPVTKWPVGLPDELKWSGRRKDEVPPKK